MNKSGPCLPEGGVAKLGAKAGSDDHISASSYLKQPRFQSVIVPTPLQETTCCSQILVGGCGGACLFWRGKHALLWMAVSSYIVNNQGSAVLKSFPFSMEGRYNDH